MENKVTEMLFDGGNDSDDILEQLLTSNHYYDNGLNISKFLDEDNTIDIEKLELAIILLIQHLEKSVKFENPIYVNLGNMSEYVERRGLIDLNDIIEDSSFILGFSQAIADENKIYRDVIVRFRGRDA
jgi:hypothetical protein